MSYAIIKYQANHRAFFLLLEQTTKKPDKSVENY